MELHTRDLVANANQNVNARKMLKNHGLRTSSCGVVYAQLTLVSRLTQPQRGIVLAILQKMIDCTFCSTKLPPQINDIIKSADRKLFGKILTCASHVLHSFLSPVVNLQVKD